MNQILKNGYFGVFWPLKIGIYRWFLGVWTKKSNSDFRDFWFSIDKNRFFNFFRAFWNSLDGFQKVLAGFRWSCDQKMSIF